jgi:DNA-binding XRE family transcriptional regulator
MRKYCGAIYKKARKDANLTQEQASELLPIPKRTSSAYENGDLLPSGELVCRMIEVYNANWLWYMHLKNNNPVGKKYLPDINLGRLSANVLRLQKEMADVYQANNSLVEVACDDEISKNEEKKWNIVLKEIKELMSACVSLMISN